MAPDRAFCSGSAPVPAEDLMNWIDSIAVSQLGDRRFRAYVDEQWTSLQGVHGGVVAAIAVNAAAIVLRDEGVDPAVRLRAATFGYVRGNAVGSLDVDIDIIRRGRALTTTHVRVTQGDKTTTVARFHHSTPWEGLEFSDVPPPMTKPDDAVRLQVPPPAHLNNTETYLHPDTTCFGGADRAEWIAWSRPADGNTFDAAWLTMFGDYFPPAVFARISGPVRAVTIEYSIQIHSTAATWTLAERTYLAARMHTVHSHDGFAVEDGWIHLPDGTLLATVRQTRLAG
jgi:acyl-CoA thioesterase